MGGLSEILSLGLESYTAGEHIVSLLDSNADMLEAQITAHEQLTELLETEKVLQDKRQHLRLLEELSSGMEGLMVEVQHVNNPAEPTEAELTILQNTAREVRKELLGEDDEKMIIDIENGSLVGSQEGLAEAIGNVAKKLKFSYANFTEALGLAFKGETDPVNKLVSINQMLRGEVGKLKTSTYSFTLPANLVKALTNTDDADVLKSMKDFPAAMKAWGPDDVSVFEAHFKKWYPVMVELHKTTSKDDFFKVFAKLKDFAFPLPTTAKKYKKINGSRAVFNIYVNHVSLGGYGKYYYIDVPDSNKDDEVAIDNALVAARKAEVVIGYYTENIPKDPKPVELELSASELAGVLDTIEASIKEIRAWYTGMASLSPYFKELDALVKLGETFDQQDFVDKTIRSYAIDAHNAINATFMLAFFNGIPCIKNIHAMQDFVRKAVSGSDLSK